MEGAPHVEEEISFITPPVPRIVAVVGGGEADNTPKKQLLPPEEPLKRKPGHVAGRETETRHDPPTAAVNMDNPRINNLYYNK